MHLSVQKQILITIIGIFILILLGSTGYHFIEDWPWFDGLWMTVITLTTIGYSETHEMSQEGRIFTLGLIVVGVVMFGLLVSNLTRAIIESGVAEALGRRKLFKDINQLKNHYILCGAGRVGRRIIDELRKKGVDFIVIENNETVATKLLQQGILVLNGDATDENVLEGARVRDATALLTAASGDADNVYIVLTARGLNPNLYIVARATDQSAERQLMRAGANKVVSPVMIGSHRMAQAALSPAVADFIELTTMTESLDLNFDQIWITQDSKLDGVQLKDSGIRSQCEVIIVAITKENGKMIFSPGGDFILSAGDLMIAIGTQEGLQSLEKLAKYSENGKKGFFK